LTNLQGANLQEANLQLATLQGLTLDGLTFRELTFMELTFKRLSFEDLIYIKRKNLSLDQLSKVKTLHNAKLDEELLVSLKEKHPALFEVPYKDE